MTLLIRQQPSHLLLCHLPEVLLQCEPVCRVLLVDGSVDGYGRFLFVHSVEENRQTNGNEKSRSVGDQPADVSNETDVFLRPVGNVQHLQYLPGARHRTIEHVPRKTEVSSEKGSRGNSQNLSKNSLFYVRNVGR